MNINEAVTLIEGFLADYRNPRVWNPREMRVLPSGDHNNNIKIWFDFGPGVTDDELEELKRKPIERLLDAHPDLRVFSLEVRAESLETPPIEAISEVPTEPPTDDTPAGEPDEASDAASDETPDEPVSQDDAE